VNDVLRAHGANTLIGGYGSSKEGDYYGVYKDAGGTQVPLNQAKSGDLIQFVKASDKTFDYPSEAGLHTAIIVGRDAKSGQLIVVDSNWKHDELVHQHLLDPTAYAGQRGTEFTIWRFGQP